MLRSRVLLHYTPGGYVSCAPQEVHTLAAWTLWRLVAEQGTRAHVVRRRPEFWRPEQRRPRGLLRFAVGEEVIVLARSTRFRPVEVRALEAVLAFVAHRASEASSVAVMASGARAAAGAPAAAGRPATARGALAALVGAAPPWRRLLQDVARVAPTGCAVVLHGETGTGKEHLARALHEGSARAARPFVAVNCATLEPSLVASELFGHVRGAFSGADRAHEGLFVAAHGGTLFLDEVAELAPAVQAALLRALEQREVLPVGGTRPRPADVRIVSASHADLGRRVDEGSFRADLWHRLNVVTLEVPPLRERLEDLPLLCEHLLARAGLARRVHPEALALLARHGWPGNVRELDHVLRAACVLSDPAAAGPAGTAMLAPEAVQRALAGRRVVAGRAADPLLPPRQAALLEAMGPGWHAAPDLARAAGTSVRSAQRELARLLDAGLVLRSGLGRALRYRRAAPPSA